MPNLRIYEVLKKVAKRKFHMFYSPHKTCAPVLIPKEKSQRNLKYKLAVAG
jgi:hypothetical protein